MKAVAPKASFDIGAWLRGLGLAQYEAVFREQGIDLKLLPTLTTQDLKDLGVGEPLDTGASFSTRLRKFRVRLMRRLRTRNRRRSSA